MPRRTAAIQVEGLSNPMNIAKRLSPLPLKDRGVPTISIHGNADTVVPYSQSVQLSEALRKNGIKEKLITIDVRPLGSALKLIIEPPLN